MRNDPEKLAQEIWIKECVRTAECEASYFEFFKDAWKILEPKTRLKLNWHIDYLCSVLENEVIRIGNKIPKIDDIAINISPRSAKSYICTIMLCPWAWIHYPHLRFINSSHSNALATKHCMLSRALIQSDWYQKRWGQRFSLSKDNNKKTMFSNNHRGERISTSVGGTITGEGADIITADDLMSPKHAFSDAKREEANFYWDNTLFNRLNDPDVGVRIIVMQRLHEDDITGHVLKSEEVDIEFQEDQIETEWRHISIPAESSGLISPPELIEKYDDEGLFFPERFTKRLLNFAKKKGTTMYSGQYLQKTENPGGNIFKRQWFNFTDKVPEDWEYESMTQSWDCAFKGLDDSDYVVGTVWGKKKGKHYLVRMVRGKFDFNETIREIKKVTLLHPKAHRKIIEDKANGPAIMSALQSTITGIVPFLSNDPKVARYSAAAPVAESGSIWIPNPEKYYWAKDFIDEVTKVPKAKNDDIADSFTQYLLMEEKDSLETLRQFMNNF